MEIALLMSLREGYRSFDLIIMGSMDTFTVIITTSVHVISSTVSENIV